MDPLGVQVAWLFLLALPVACVSWTVTQEEIFREFRLWCKGRCEGARTLLGRKWLYPFTCGYCFSHYVTILVLAVTGYHLLFVDWRGYVIAGFSLVWVANMYMSVFEILRKAINDNE